MKNLLRILDRAGGRPLGVLGVSATRLLLGFVGFMYYASQYGDRAYLFGPQGVLPWTEFVGTLHESGAFSLYELSHSRLWFELLFHAGILAAIAVTIGVGGRVGLAVHWTLLWSLYQRQPVLLDGGDNLAYLVIPMLLLTRCYSRLSMPSGLARRLSKRVPGAVRALSTPLHNLGLLAIATQLCLVYVVSGLYKVQGQMWQDGTALFYVLRVAEFNLPGVSSLVYENDVLVVVGTYITTLFLVYFPLGILVPRLRPWAAVASIGFHLSIALLMGLTGFALTMVACDLIFLSRPLEEALRRTSTLVKRANRTPRPNPPRPEAPPAAPPVLAFDGDCGFCQTAVDRITATVRPQIQAMAWQSLPHDLTAPHLARLDHEVLLFQNGRVLAGGAQALAVYVGHSPRRRYRLAATALGLPAIRGSAQLAYRAISRNRRHMPGSSGACAVPASRP
ncbi:DCC1-like thiol-disulfide oxidoreductase family protein [Streptomyces sp. NPDC051546]|uniref:DCC1-like thiol-disulfide oxidoreductase family protein n=1 Tax=Streptomyces sp. NPDC051546 TaxID=3365655 RepID=UPI0037ADAC75